MALDKRTFRLALTALLALVFLQLTGCSESLHGPFGPADGSIGAATGNARGGPSGATLDNGIPNIHGGRILRTREGEYLTASDVTVEYNPDDLPPGVEPQVVFSDPAYFQFTILPAGIEARHSLKVLVDYSKADLAGADENDLEIWGVSDDQYVAYPSAIDTGNSTIGYKTTRFSRYALARD